MIKTKLQHVVGAENILIPIMGTKIPVSAAYALNKLVGALKSDLEFYYAERQKLFTELGEDKGKGTMEIPEANKAAFVKRLTELLESDVELSIAPLDLRKLDGHVSLSISDMQILEPFVTMPEA